MNQVQMKLKNVFGLKEFDRILTEIYIKWSGVIIIVGDFNIDLLNERKQPNVITKTFYIHSYYVNI